MGRAEHRMQRDGQLDDAEVRAKVASGRADRTDELFADLAREHPELGRVELTEDGGSGDPFQDPVWAHDAGASSDRPDRCRTGFGRVKPMFSATETPSWTTTGPRSRSSSMTSSTTLSGADAPADRPTTLTSRSHAGSTSVASSMRCAVVPVRR